MKKIMVVDDDRKFLDEISRVLTLSGYDTIVFSDGNSALEEAIKIKPDVILLDLKMEGTSGFKIADQLRRSPEAGQISIIATTGFYIEKEHHLLLKMCGIKKCLIKPINPLDVIMAVEAAVKYNKMAKSDGKK